MAYIKISCPELEELNRHVEKSGYTPVLPVYFYIKAGEETYYFNSLGFPCKISKEFLQELRESGRLKEIKGGEDLE